MSDDGTDTPSKWTVLIAVGLTLFITLMASMVSFLVLRDIAEDFDVSLRTVGWVVIVESLIVAAFLLPLGDVSDRVGKYHTLRVGIVVFGIGLVLTGLSTSFSFLIVARIVTSFGNTLIGAVGTGILVAAFPPEERGFALGGQVTAVALGAGLGPLIGGFLLAEIDWKTLFLLLAIPTALTLAIVSRIHERAPQPSLVEHPFDYRGALLSSAFITIFILGLNDPFEFGLLSPITLVAIIVIGLLIFAFVRVELAQALPMIDLRVFTNADFRRAAIIRVVGFVASSSILLLIPLYLLGVKDASVQLTGAILGLFALGLLIGAQISGPVYDRLGARLPMVIGLIGQIGILVLLVFIDADSSLILVSIASLGNGIGQGLWNVPANSVLMGSIPDDALGVGGAFSNVDRTVGSVTGQAAGTGIVTRVMVSQGFDVPLGELTGTIGAAEAFIDGWRVTFVAGIVLSVIALAIAFRTDDGPLHHHRQQQAEREAT